MIGLEGLAWAFMSEGSFSFSLGRSKTTKTGYSIRPTATITNVDVEFIDALAKKLKELGIPYGTSTRNDPRKNRRRIVGLGIIGWRAVEDFINAIYPHLIGNGRKTATILLECIKKFRRPHGWVPYSKRYSLEDERKRVIGIMQYKDEIMKYHKSVARRKYSVRFFEDLWGISI